MKVAEPKSDRKCDVHLHVHGKVEALKEYGEYIDPIDNAICCFVPVEDGQKIKILGSFSGTTLNIFQDAIVDGVHRKAVSYNPKAVRDNKPPKKFMIESFLYKTDKGIIDTDMNVCSLSDVVMTQGDGPETIGTIELRVYATRQFNVTHKLAGVTNHMNCDKNIEDEVINTISYREIPPTLQLTFEENCAALDSVKASSEHRKMTALRPGDAPWAIFRFHYRDHEAIAEKEMQLTFNPYDKAVGETRTLALEPVPLLVDGSKPPTKDDGDSSTRTSSPMPPTPGKGSRRDSASKPSTLSRRQRHKAIVPPQSPTEEDSLASPDHFSKLETHEEIDKDLEDHISPDISVKSPTKEMAIPMADKDAVKGETDGVVTTSIMDNDSSKVPETSTNGNIEKTANKPIKPVATKSFKNPVKKLLTKDQPTISGTASTIPADKKTTGSADDGTIEASSLIDTDTDTKLTNGNAASEPAQVKDVLQKVPELPVTPVKKPVVKPAPIVTTPAVVQEKSLTPPTPITPAKRPAELANDAKPELKRTKVTAASAVPTIVPQVASSSPSPRPMTMERKLADQRKRLAEVRQKRQQMAQKQATIEEQMTPYKQRMTEELERLAREMQEEENAYFEDEQHFTASVEILEEFKRSDGGE
ncbi:hypothetical protein P153DRAFT_428111 [Dothidotthia symphoricarpi CBS 119687]|uniref:Uncharacterized protein n=1 Tax=Dothidotthia symphoricarpi CBS 119687 TaxID=1392245 RepID=A0A6A6AT00_9PLEO|nr:uncharacterized protein P153DRAFT_428111 [Dothidotthia symphoricarpi CBS 119687]KAF2134308.1 hypothetical protein P153DRAFT_428111 [Dothidotthia symphoricarpi CBS 119687]